MTDPENSLSRRRAAYDGDDALAALLEKEGAGRSVAEIRALAAAVIAAPPAHDPAAWVALAAPDAGAALSGQLVALASEMRAESDSGLGLSPAPAERLDALRAELSGRGLDGFIVPLADEHQGEFVAPGAQRLAWLTGFTGSAGLAVALADKAAIFVDGRYTLQVREQVDTGRFTPLHLTESPPGDWIAAALGAGARLGYDPWLHTPDAVERYRKACDKAGAALEACDDNPLDAVWRDQPPPPVSPAVPHDVRHAGADPAAKRQLVAEILARDGLAAAVLTAPDSIAWLLNMRGGDIANTPVALAFAIIDRDGEVALFIDPRKPAPGLRRHLGNGVALSPPDGFGAALDALGAAAKRVRADPKTAASWIFDRLAAAGADIVRGDDPCALPKACKNEAELAGARAAHVRDGAALTRFLAWLAGAAPTGGVSEISAAEKLYSCRAGNDLFRGPSFETISGAGPNGAIVHYRVDAASNRTLAPGDVYLIDSGAQYLDGTTDVTRTVLIAGAEPPAGARERFTRVLKGHIALATARFPAGTGGGQLDTLARTALWQAGLDFDHGTGHGVGAYLGVHEGPARIAKRGGEVALKPGMILSNEPGYYQAGAYGIRIENLLAVRPAEAAAGGDGGGNGGTARPMLEFETLTLAPIDRALIEPDLMTPDEIAWLDAYHARVRETLTPLVDAKTAKWLKAATKGVEKR